MKKHRRPSISSTVVAWEIEPSLSITHANAANIPLEGAIVLNAESGDQSVARERGIEIGETK